jgi:hypothetical protein
MQQHLFVLEGRYADIPENTRKISSLLITREKTAADSCFCMTMIDVVSAREQTMLMDSRYRYVKTNK